MTDKLPTVSIITVAYNAAATIEDSIKSVLSQDYPNIEYIIIDGASKDNTLEIVQNHQDKIAKIVSEPDKGIYDGMNKGVAMASGDIVAILNSDDFYADKQVVSNVVSLFEDGVEGVYADLDYVDPVDTEKVVRRWVSGEYQKGAFKKGWMPPHPTFFVKRSVYERYGDFTLELKSAADYEFMLRVIHKEGIALKYLPKITVKMRTGGMSNASIKNRFRSNCEDKKAWELNGLKPGLLTFIRKPLSKIKQYLKR
ncbi:MAG: glycosyltransferase family 2 protein [Crocinitomicaceae bacterium]